MIRRKNRGLSEYIRREPRLDWITRGVTKGVSVEVIFKLRYEGLLELTRPSSVVRSQFSEQKE